MKSRKNLTFCSKADVSEIHCGVISADINIVGTSKGGLRIEYSKSFSPYFTEKDGVVTLKQQKIPFLKHRRPVVTIYVPDCYVPDIRIDAERSNVKVDGGIFNDAGICGKEIKCELNGATFHDLEIKADHLDVSTGDITVRNMANTVASDGRVEFDKTFCKNATCRVKKGNIGLSCTDCEYAVLNTEEGNIAACMQGDESDYSIDLECPALSIKRDTSRFAKKTIRARTLSGNVVLDFEKSGERTDVADKRHMRAHA